VPPRDPATVRDDLAARSKRVQADADRLRVLTDTAPVGIFQVDANRRYVYVNARWSEITGLASADTLGCDWSVIIDSDHRHAFDAVLEDGAGPDPGDGGRDHGRSQVPLRPYRFELTLIDGTPRVVLVSPAALPGGAGGPGGWVGTVVDVTSEHLAEVATAEAYARAGEVSRLKMDFLANVSHEIRTPMNGVIGMTELLLDTDLDPTQRRYTRMVLDSGRDLMSIIDDILDFSKVDAGKLVIDTEAFSVHSVVSDVVGLVGEAGRTRGLELTMAVDDAVPTEVTGDRGRVRQVLGNLVGNAVKFTDVGAVTVRVTAPEVAGGTALLRFDIADTGTGIAADQLEMIFHAFVQADSSTSRRFGGTGLGLSICRQLVTLMGGRCGVSSRPGAGSTFWFTVSVGVA